MASGGARNRSGPPPNPNSGRSETLGRVFRELPAEGYHEPPPEFPLPWPGDRELDVWDEIWTSPQALAWSETPWRWRSIGLWVRFSVRTEHTKCPASLLGEVHRYADQIGLTPAGMKENGWIITKTEKAPEVHLAPARDFMARLSGNNGAE